MFDTIQHIGYLTGDLDKAVAWFVRAFGAVNAGGGALADGPVVPGGGRNAFVRFGGVEAELMQPADTRALPKDTLVMHHVGYVVADIAKAAAQAKAKGLSFLSETPFTNPVGQQVHYFDPAMTHGVLIHLTQVPTRSAVASRGAGQIDSIIHPGYLVRDLDAAVAWYADKLGGVNAGGGPSRRGGRVAFVNCGGAQVELIEPPDAGTMSSVHVLDHVGYVTGTLDADIAVYRGRGLQFATPEPAINPIGQTLIYFETSTSMGSRMHLTKLPA